tara:strand:- start:147 stop:419 length:273 start_codon:yes stop_codon:yes gene_type:complete
MVLIVYRESVMSDDLNKIEAAVFRRLINHFKENTEVQNIDVMKTAGFCRNCLSRWYREEAKDLGIEINEDYSKEIIYGMPYNEWKEKFQK